MNQLRNLFTINLDIRSFVLKSQIPKGGMLRPTEPGEDLPESLRKACKELGLKMKPPKIIPYTLPALELTELSKGYGLSESFHRAIYKAYWENEQNIGDSAVLEEIAIKTGIPRPAVLETIRHHPYLDTVIKHHSQAEILGFKGIPAMLIGKTRFVGALDIERLQQAIEQELLNKR